MHASVTSIHKFLLPVMKTRTFILKFLTPAFLGNAEQNGVWRTPPIKALLRQWWRVAYAAERQFDVDVASMRHEEGLLFGHAWLEDDRDEHGNKVAARKSAVRLRLNALEQQSAWAVGSPRCCSVGYGLGHQLCVVWPYQPWQWAA